MDLGATAGEEEIKSCEGLDKRKILCLSDFDK
jgi:hypothetical protein